jgi:integrase
MVFAHSVTAALIVLDCANRAKKIFNARRMSGPITPRIHFGLHFSSPSRYVCIDRFVHESGWIPTNPASHLKPLKITEPPTAPFTREEVTSILNACDIYPDKPNAVRLRASVFLLRYSGLRIRDAVTLSRNRIQDDKLLLYTPKTGTAVYCPLPPFVV